MAYGISTKPVFTVTELIDQMIARREQLKSKSPFSASANTERESEEITTTLTILEYMFHNVRVTLEETLQRRGLTYDALTAREDEKPNADNALARELALMSWLLVVLGEDPHAMSGVRKITFRDIAPKLVTEKNSINAEWVNNILLTLRIAAQHLFALSCASSTEVDFYRVTLYALGYDLENHTQRAELLNYFATEQRG